MGETQETWVRSLGREDPLEEGRAARSSLLAWRPPWTEESCRLQFVGSQRVGNNWAPRHSRKGPTYGSEMFVIFVVVVNCYLGDKIHCISWSHAAESLSSLSKTSAQSSRSVVSGPLWPRGRQASLSIADSQSLPTLMSIESAKLNV